MSAPAPFDRRVLIGLGSFALGSFVFGLVVSMLGVGWQGVESSQTDTFSRSALGHHAAVALLKTLNVPVLVARSEPSRRAQADDLLLLAEPPVWSEVGARAKAVRATLAQAKGATLVVLPRFSGRSDAAEPTWLAQRFERPPSEALLATLGVPGAIQHQPADAPWVLPDGWPMPAPITAVQTLSSDALEPIVSIGGQTVLGYVAGVHPPRYVLTDPLFINTAGLAQPDNAAFFMHLLGRGVGEGGAVIFDETLHGFGTEAGLWARLFEFPLALAMVQAVLVLVLLLWASMRRFGAPAPAPPALGRGRAVLIENVARMGWFSGHSGHTLTRYWLATRRAVAHGLHAPLHLKGPELDAWLDRVAATRQVQERISGLAPVIDAAALRARESERLMVAQRIHAWRQAMLGAT
jgi:hypothetical protein